MTVYGRSTLNIGAERFNTAGSTGSGSTLAATARTKVLIYCHCRFFILLFPFSGIHVDCSPSVPSLTTSYAHGTSSTSLQYNTVTQCLQRTVERFPDREAVVFVENGIRKTFAKFQQDVSICVLNIRSDMHQRSIHNIQQQRVFDFAIFAGGSSCSWAAGPWAETRRQARHVGTQHLRVDPDPIRHSQSWHYFGESKW